ncbi:MFS transporter [Paenibacillus barcinonensis]|uniref:EmrB/QacA subfamily drug resistance transporter n=1 Tax=Paenibacillus barcinonensis TaxID=198119 RepID=A0A2V4W0J2_PAEBA|nr:MFS transporter [Paenibacillus barcinonensis]PYE47860.1 EmrB/QacA subfamily drug resistance transporter [Paenibacillus barcinonensis]QKS59050.1 MFS transporter [Paenibacillus barcinonensis]
MGTRNRWLIISVGLGMLLNPLNSSMIAVAIPRLQKEFQLDFTVISWIIFAFYIASTISNPVVGKASDIWGRKKVFLAGLLVALAASLGAPFAPNFSSLIFLRVVQSIGTSMLISVGMAIIRIHVHEKQGTAVSMLNIFQSGAAAIGPFVGGVLIYVWDWSAIFFINIPFVVASFLMAWKMIPSEEMPASVIRHMSLRKWWSVMDGTGIMLFTAGLVPLLISLLSMKAASHISLTHIMIGLAGLIAIGAFIRHELKVTAPFIPLRTLAKYPAITWINIEFIVVNLLFYTLFFGIPSYLQVVRHVSEFQTGILMLTLGLCSLAASPLAGRWIDKSGPRPALLMAAILMVSGSLWLANLNEDSPIVSVCVALAAFGFSNGLNGVGMQAALFRSSPKEIIGVASGLFSSSRNLGAILSSLLIGIMMGGQFSYTGFHLLGIALTIIALLLLYMSWTRRDSGQYPQSRYH